MFFLTQIHLLYIKLLSVSLLPFCLLLLVGICHVTKLLYHGILETFLFFHRGYGKNVFSVPTKKGSDMTNKVQSKDTERKQARKTILIVEDNVDIGLILVEFFQEELSYQCF